MQSNILVTILSMALIIYLMRLSGFWLIGNLTISPRVEQWLRQIPPAILISIIAPKIAAGGPTEWGAGLLTIYVGFRTKNILLTMIVGIGTIWAVRNFL